MLSQLCSSLYNLSVLLSVYPGDIVAQKNATKWQVPFLGGTSDKVSNKLTKCFHLNNLIINKDSKMAYFCIQGAGNALPVEQVW